MSNNFEKPISPAPVCEICHLDHPTEKHSFGKTVKDAVKRGAKGLGAAFRGSVGSLDKKSDKTVDRPEEKYPTEKSEKNEE